MIKTMLHHDIHIVRKRVKHARIRVSVHQENSIQVTVPISYNEDDVQRLLLAKEGWIKKSLTTLSERTRNIPLAEDQFLFLGRAYTFILDPQLNGTVQVLEAQGIIKASSNLLDTEQRKQWYRKEARQIFSQKLDTVARQYGLRYNRFFLRSQKTKWGTCSIKKNISLNYRLVKAPEMVIDYMVAHELAHTRALNHADEFWQLVDVLCPWRTKAEQWLDTYGINL